MTTALLVAAAGAAGVLARYGIVEAAGDRSATATVAINVLGSFVLGLLVGAGASDQTRLAIGTGLLGGFTTFSAFSVQVVTDVEAGRTGHAVVYVVASVALGILAAFAGYALARRA